MIQFNWTIRRLGALGQESDTSLARTWKISVGRVQRKRTSLTIPACTGFRRHDWASVKHLMHTLSDRAISEQTGIPIPSIRNYRKRNHITHTQHAQSVYKWKKTSLQRLGKIPDAALAKQLGICQKTVTNKRSALDIPSYTSTQSRWSAQSRKLLGMMSDMRLATITSLSQAAVTKERTLLGIPPFHENYDDIEWTAGMDRQLGSCPDKLLAVEWGISTSAVNTRRNFLGMDAYGSSPSNKHQWTQRELDLLGTDADIRIAKKTKLSPTSIAYKRRALGIPAWGRP